MPAPELEWEAYQVTAHAGGTPRALETLAIPEEQCRSKPALVPRIGGVGFGKVC